MEKNEISNLMLEKRKALEKEEIKEKGALAKEKLFSLEEYKKAKTVMFFVSFRKEIYTHDMVREALKDKTVIVPKIINFEIAPCIIKDFSELQEGKYRILEPVEVHKAELNKIDIVLVPGLIFDKKGYRLGYGRGYYDNFLRKLKTLKIGLCMDFQIVEKIEHKEWDVPLDIIVTEKRVIKI